MANDVQKNGFDLSELSGKKKAERAASRSGRGDKRPEAEIYFNVGVQAPIDGSETFVSIGGFGVDNVPAARVTANSSAEWREMAEIKNQIFDHLRPMWEDLEPGQELILDIPFTLQLRRRAENEDSIEQEEARTAAQAVVSSLFGSRKAG